MPGKPPTTGPADAGMEVTMTNDRVTVWGLLRTTADLDELLEMLTNARFCLPPPPPAA